MDTSNPARTDGEHPSQSRTAWEHDDSFQTLSFGEHGLYPQFILFGDSITQQSALTLQARLQDVYIRRADILNRGFSGYTATLALSTLPHFLPPSTPKPSEIQPPIRLSTIFFGANDACLPGNAQHVPLPKYITSLRKLAEYHVFKNHGTRIVFITPGPIDEWQLSKPLTRTSSNAKIYAEAVRALAKEMEIPCVDLWTAFMRMAGYSPSTSHTQAPTDSTNGPINADLSMKTIHTPESVQQERQITELQPLPGSLAAPSNQVLSTLLADGLHFTERAYHVLFDELMTTIRRDIPECSPENLPTIFRGWRDILGVLPAPAEGLPSSEPELEHTEDTSTVLSETEVDGQITPETDWLDVQPDAKPEFEDEDVTPTGMIGGTQPEVRNGIAASVDSTTVESQHKREDEVTVTGEVIGEAQRQTANEVEAAAN